MYAQYNSEFDALAFLRSIDRAGLDAQALKQMVSHQRGEFLRLMYRADGRITGSLARAVSGFTSGDGQTSPRIGGPETAYAVNEGLHRLIRRGGDHTNVERIRYHVVGYWATVVTRDKNGRSRRHPLKHDVLTASLSSGGAGCGRFATPCDYAYGIPDRPRPARLANSVIGTLPAHGSKQAVEVAWSRLKDVLPKKPDWKAHAEPMYIAALPDSIISKWRKSNMGKLAQWYQECRDATITVVQKLSARAIENVNIIVESSVRYIERVLKRGLPPTKRGRLDEAGAHILHSALKTVSPIPGMGMLMGKNMRDRLSQIYVKAGYEAASAIQRVARYGPRIAHAMVLGTVSLALDTGGLIPTTHRYISDICINNVIDMHVNDIRFSPNLEEKLSDYAQATARALVALVKRND
jgi:hypothetical protein